MSFDLKIMKRVVSRSVAVTKEFNKIKQSGKLKKL